MNASVAATACGSRAAGKAVVQSLSSSQLRATLPAAARALAIPSIGEIVCHAHGSWVRVVRTIVNGRFRYLLTLLED